MSWRGGGSNYYQNGYRRPDPPADPVPARGYGERLYAELKARFGTWSPVFLRLVELAYNGKIPPRILHLAERLERERPWEIGVPSCEPTGLPPTITIVNADGSVRERYRPTPEEWHEAGVAAGLVEP